MTTHAMVPKYRPAGDKFRERIGQRFGRWTIIDVLGYQGTGPRVLCRCECGCERPIPLGNLTFGLSTQCQFCARKQIAERRKRDTAIRHRQFERAEAKKGRTVAGWRKNVPLYKCPCCGVLTPSGRCISSQKLDVPYRHPESIGTIGRRVGLSSQRIHQLIEQYGWDGMLRNIKARSARAGGGGQ